MQRPRRGAAFILGHEAVYLQAYRDPVGIWTIGGGNDPVYSTNAFASEDQDVGLSSHDKIINILKWEKMAAMALSRLSIFSDLTCNR